MASKWNASRRGVLGGLLASALPPWVSAAESGSIKTLAAAKGVLFGSAVGAGRAGTLTGTW